MKYFDQNQPYNARAGNHMNIHGEEMYQQTLKRILKAQINYCACTQSALTIGFLKCMFNYDSKGSVVRISPIDGASQQCIRTTLPPHIL